MKLLYRLGSIVDEAKNEYLKEKSSKFNTVLTAQRGNKEKSVLALGSNERFIDYLKNNGYNEKIQFIYVDPPFYSKSEYRSRLSFKNEDDEDKNIDMFAYDDKWNNNVDSYIKEMAKGLFAMKDLLKEDGAIAVHLDWHAVHYGRLIMDEIFGEENFINEIIWQYKSGGSSKRFFARKHDNIIIYSKSSAYKFNTVKEKSYNRGLKPYRFKNVEEFKDDVGWYTMVNARDVWQIDMVGRTSSDRTGYATQKPKELLRRLICAFTDEGDTVADFFSGSGTTMTAADELNRNWICCDVNPAAVSINLAKTVDMKNTFEFIVDERVNFKLAKADIKFNGGKLQIENYHVDINKDNFNKTDIDYIIKLAETEPKRLVNYVSFDTDYDGRVHKSIVSAKSIDDEIIESIEERKMKGATLHILAMDVFGNLVETRQ